MRRAVPDVVMTTMGQSSRTSLTDRKPYRWRGTPGWMPGSRGDDEVIGRPAGPPPMSAARLQRIARFAALLDQGLTIEEAGKQMGVAPRTAELYEREGQAPPEAGVMTPTNPAAGTPPVTRRIPPPEGGAGPVTPVAGPAGKMSPQSAADGVAAGMLTPETGATRVPVAPVRGRATRSSPLPPTGPTTGAAGNQNPAGSEQRRAAGKLPAGASAVRHGARQRKPPRREAARRPGRGRPSRRPARR